MKINCSIFGLVVCLVAFPVRSASLSGIPAFIDEMVVRHQFDRKELEKIFKRAKHLPLVVKTISLQKVAKPWLEYRAAFVNSQRVQFGLKFWRKYRKTLQRAEREFGVPQEIIIAIIGVETIYGKSAGTFRTLDALTTLAFDYPPREEFFRSELENYLLLAREQQFDMLNIRGSYAGAMGIPQFMPSSYRNYAVDFNGNKKTDLLREAGDAIGSVANYLKGYGWANSFPVAVRVKIDKEKLPGDFSAPRSIADWAEIGIVPREELSDELSARLLDFTLADGKEWWLVLNNFEVITRYNNSDFYAMSVFQLSQELKAASITNAVK